MKSTDMLTRSALALCLALAAMPLAHAAGQRLTEAEIGTTFKGMTLDGVYSDGRFFTENYQADGSIRYHDGAITDTGKWSIKDGMFCTFYDGQKGACFYVDKESPNCFAFYEKDEDSRSDAAREEWTSQGWSRAEKSTCTIDRDDTI